MNVPEPQTIKSLRISRAAGKLLGGYALVAMHGWFIFKLALPSPTGLLESVVGIAAITGMVTSLAFFVSSYGAIANAPDALLDERELADRNRAYVFSFKYLVAMTLAGGILPEILAKVFAFSLSIGVMKNFMMLMFTTALVLPGTVLAWSEKDVD